MNETQQQELSEQFLAAVKEGNVEEVSSLIEAGANVNTTGKDRRTPLHFAVENGHVEIINTLLKVKGIDINVSDQEYGRTPLHFAIENGHVEIINTLLKVKGIDINVSDQEYGRTPLHFAVENGHEGVVKLLIEKGADVDASDQDGRTPLHFAVENGHEGVVKLLIEKGADVDASDQDGWTPLHFATESDHKDIIRLLIEGGANVNAAGRDIWISYSWTLYGGVLYGWTPLHLATKYGCTEIINTLLEVKGINVNVSDQDRRIPLHFAAENGHEGVVKLLIEKGADVDAANKDGWTPLHFAAENGHEGVVKLLIEKGADVDASDQDRRTPLHLTVKRNYKETIITLMDEGADINRLVFIENNESYEIIIRYIAKLEAAGLYISPSLVEGKEIFLDTSHYRFSNYLQHSRNCKKEVQEIEKENKLLHDFLKESDIGKLVSIFEENESVSNRLNNQEGLKKHYPEYAYILISKTSEVKKVIFLHNHKPLIDVLSKNWKKDFQKMSFVGIENFFMSRKRDHFNLQQEIGVTLIDCLNFEDVKERHIPTLKVKTLVKIINNQDVNSNLEYQSTEQIQGASQSLH